MMTELTPQEQAIWNAAFAAEVVNVYAALHFDLKLVAGIAADMGDRAVKALRELRKERDGVGVRC